MQSPPGLQFLHCLKNDATGGTSLFMDSFKAVEVMAKKYPEELRTLKTTPLAFEYKNDNKHFYYLRPTVEVLDINVDYLVSYAPMFQGQIPYHDNKLVSRFYEALKRFEIVIRENSYIHKTRMNPGDLVIFANRRVLHGREQFDATSGDRHLKGTYVSLDEFRDKVRRFVPHVEMGRLKVDGRE